MIHDQHAEKANIMVGELHEKERFIIHSCHSNAGRNSSGYDHLSVYTEIFCKRYRYRSGQGLIRRSMGGHLYAVLR